MYTPLWAPAETGPVLDILCMAPGPPQAEFRKFSDLHLALQLVEDTII